MSWRLRKALPALSFLIGVAAFLPTGVMQALTALGLVIAGLGSRRRGLMVRPLQAPSFYPMAAVLAWFFLNLLVQWPQNAAGLRRIFHILLPALAWWLSGLLHTSDRSDRLYRAYGFGLLTGGVMACVLVVGSQSLGWNISSFFRYLSEVVGNSSSRVMMMLAVLSLVLITRLLFPGPNGESPRIRIVTAMLAGLFACVLLGWSFSRNAQLVFLVVLPLLVLQRWPSARGFCVAAGLSAGVAVLAYLCSSVVQLRVEMAWQEAQSFLTRGQYDGSVSVRLRMYQVAIEQMLSSPIWGTGIGSWSEIWPRFGTAFPGMLPTNNPHNDLLLYGMETGIPGLLSLLMLHAVFIRIGWKTRSRDGASALALSAAVLVVCLFNAPYRDANLGLALIFWMSWTARRCTACNPLSSDLPGRPRR